jgi:hypothetical protein
MHLSLCRALFEKVIELVVRLMAGYSVVYFDKERGRNPWIINKICLKSENERSAVHDTFYYKIVNNFCQLLYFLYFWDFLKKVISRRCVYIYVLVGKVSNECVLWIYIPGIFFATYLIGLKFLMSQILILLFLIIREQVLQQIHSRFRYYALPFICLLFVCLFVCLLPDVVGNWDYITSEQLMEIHIG